LERSGSPPREPPERGTADFLEIMIADWRNGRVYTGVNLGSNTEIFCERSTLFTQLDLTLQAATDLEFRISLLGDCAVEVSEMKILRREPVLPGNPRILFIVEDRPDPTLCPHQGISSLAGYLRERGIAAHALITSMTDDLEIERALKKHEYGWVGFTVLTGMEPSVLERARRIKEIQPDTTIIVGGPHITITGEQILLACDTINMAVAGEGEETLFQLLSGRSLASIDGLIYRDGGMVRKNKPRALFNSLAHLPLALSDIYLNDDWQAFSILTSRGCPFRCDFCSASRLWGSTIRFRPMAHIDGQLR